MYGSAYREYLRKFVANRVKVLRISYGFTQKQFAELIGVNYLTYKGYEICKSEFPLLVLLQIAYLFDVSLDSLVRPIDFQR